MDISARSMTDKTKLLSSLILRPRRLKSLTTPIFVSTYRYAYFQFVAAKMQRKLTKPFEILMEEFEKEANHRHLKGIFPNE